MSKLPNRVAASSVSRLEIPRRGRPPGGAEDAREELQRLEEGGEDVLVRVAGREHEGAEPLRMVHGHELAQRAARVVADQRHVLEVERSEQVGDQLRVAGRRAVGVGTQRGGVRAERPVGTMTRNSRARAGATSDHSSPLAITPWTRTIGSPLPSSR